MKILGKILKFLLRFTGITLELFFAALMCLFVYIIYVSDIHPPEVPKVDVGERKKVGENHYVLGNNWLRKNEAGIWEMYIEGDDYERGLIYGKLAKELCQRQEEIFVGQINGFVPSKFFQRFLRFAIGFFNKDIDEYVPQENLREIYGISQSFGDEYDYIAPKFTRHLNYHAAHDIGHALNDYSVVGCSSFSLKGAKSYNGDLLIGRNFDFYVGDEFAEDKLILFLKPTKGYAFASISWAGFTGVVSGLNEKGLSVSINASKSDLPRGGKTPISLLTREILQYASTIEEAIAIAKKRETFVSETIMVSSKIDGKTILIEKSPSKMGVYDPGTEQVLCTNHYQSDVFSKDEVNIDNINESDSKYRFDRMQELLKNRKHIEPINVAQILRDQYATHGDTLGMGNPRAINQLIAHHSIVIQPEQLLIYFSSNDYQLGHYQGYYLPSVFDGIKLDTTFYLPEDNFLESQNYDDFKKFKATKHKISRYLMFDEPLNMSNTAINAFIRENAESYVTYEMLAKYFKKKGNKALVEEYVNLALSKRVASPKVEAELRALMKD